MFCIPSDLINNQLEIKLSNTMNFFSFLIYFYLNIMQTFSFIGIGN